MKKNIMFSVLGIFLMTSSCFAQKLPKMKDLSTYKATAFVPTLESPIQSDKNAIYCATLLFAWDDIRQKVNNTLEVPASQKALKALDDSRSYKAVLKSGEYTVKTTLAKDYIEAKATFQKTLSFKKKFDSYPRLSFKGTDVPAFGVTGRSKYEIREQVKILYYKDAQNFILELSPKEEAHKIILFKSSKTFANMSDMNKEAQRLIEANKDMIIDAKNAWKYQINKEDVIMIPKFAFNIEHSFKSLVGSKCKANNVGYVVTKAWQNNAFVLNEKGAKVKSKSVVRMTKSASVPTRAYPRKEMLLDQPFFLMMRRTDASNPYLSLWIQNAELMQK